MFKKFVPSGENKFYRKAIWLYMLLLFFEGGLRKWFLPALATPLLVVRDPIVICLVVMGLSRKWLNNGYVIFMMFVSTFSLLYTLFAGHQNLLVGIYGWRMYFFYFPFIFIMAHVLTRDDLLRIGRFILYLSIPMTILIIMQFYSPQSAWVNRGVGGDTDGAGFGGTGGYFRPPATFSFIAGYVYFQLIVACYLFYYLLENNKLSIQQRIKPAVLYTALGFYLISIPYSISRTHLFQTVVIFVFVMLISLFISSHRASITKMLSFGFLAIGLIVIFNFAGKGFEAFMMRMEGSNESEGGMVEGVLGERYLGALLRPFNVEAPFFGYGMGMGTNVGVSYINNSYFNAEEEWSRIIGETGFLLGGIIIIIRVVFSISFFSGAFKKLSAGKDILPWIMAPALLIMIPQGQFGNAAGLGFAVFVAGLGLAALRTNPTDPIT